MERNPEPDIVSPGRAADAPQGRKRGKAAPTDPTRITLRAEILAAFGVTEADMAEFDAIEAANGYTAAKADAEQQRQAFMVWATAKHAELEAQYTAQLLGEPTLEP